MLPKSAKAYIQLGKSENSGTEYYPTWSFSRTVMIEGYDTALPEMSVNITRLVTFTVSFLGASLDLVQYLLTY